MKLILGLSGSSVCDRLCYRILHTQALHIMHGCIQHVLRVKQLPTMQLLCRPTSFVVFYFFKTCLGPDSCFEATIEMESWQGTRTLKKIFNQAIVTFQIGKEGTVKLILQTSWYPNIVSQTAELAMGQKRRHCKEFPGQ